MIEEYLAELKAILTTSSIVKDVETSKDKIFRDKYSFHMQKGNKMIVHWDNAPHHREVSTFPYHMHKGGKVFI